jgi:sporulation protein YlmC with PRC-barrel domain
MPQQYATTTPSGKQYRRVLSASTLEGDKVVNATGEDIGKIDEIMIDTRTGRVAYAVLSFGGFMGMGDKLFAVPWSRLSLDEDNKQFHLDVDKETLKQAPGFDKDNWPDMTNESWGTTVHKFYGSQPYWQ